jgi:hypothetical protein
MLRHRLWVAAWFAVLATCMTVWTASAQERCKGELVKASGKATLWGDKRATRLAIDNWQREVRQKYGEQFMDFTKARQGAVDCGASGIGVVGSRMKRCNVTGYPCHVAAEADDEEVDKDYENKDRRTMAIQRRLVRAGYLESDEVDGDFGPKTRQAVRRFQRENDLRVTGQVDERTWDRLRKFKRS